MLYLTQIRTYTDKSYVGLAEAGNRSIASGRHSAYVLAALAACGFAAAYIGVIAYTGAF